MKKKTYEAPVTELVELEAADVITASGSTGGGNKPGWGHGAGGHTGPPGHNKK